MRHHGEHHATCATPGTNRAAQRGAKAVLFSRSRNDTQTNVIKSMNFYNRSTKILKAMIIKKKTTTLWCGCDKLSKNVNDIPHYQF
jgi:hypothetical protein